MEQKPLTITDHTMFVLKTHADLVLQGWDRMEIQPLSESRAGLSVTQAGDTVRVQCNADLDLTIPAMAPVVIERVSGDAHLRNLIGSVQVQRIGGDLSAQQVGALDIQVVGGDCSTMDVAGPLAIQRVGGDLLGDRLAGPVRLEYVGGDVSLRMGGGALQLRAGGDVDISLDAVPGDGLRMVAGGDVVLGLPQSAAMELEINSRGRDIRLEVGELDEDIEKRFHRVTLGAGGPKVNIEAGGDVLVTDNPSLVAEQFEGLGNLGETLEDQWKVRLERQSEQLEDFGRNFGHKAEELTDRINRRVDEAMRQADSRMQEAMKRLEERTRRLERHGITPPIPPTPPARPVPPMPPIPPAMPGARRKSVDQTPEKKSGASEEEKLLILKMLQQNKITVEEAEKLLEALER